MDENGAHIPRRKLNPRAVILVVAGAIAAALIGVAAIAYMEMRRGDLLSWPFGKPQPEKSESEQRAAILAELSASSQAPSREERAEVLESASNAEIDASPSEQEKMDVLRSLR